jgi:hypothetical protein
LTDFQAVPGRMKFIKTFYEPNSTHPFIGYHPRLCNLTIIWPSFSPVTGLPVAAIT